MPVLLKEAIDALDVKEDGLYIDGTFGRGGHSKEILGRLGEKGRLVAIDRDPEAISDSEKWPTRYENGPYKWNKCCRLVGKS